MFWHVLTRGLFNANAANGIANHQTELPNTLNILEP